MTRFNLRFTFSAIAIVLLSAGAFAADEIKGDPYTLDVCPVSGEKLGNMGEPIQYNHEGRDIKFCCAGCIGRFSSTPAQFLAKVDKLMAEQQKKHYPLTTCAVTGNALGSMGEPLDIVVNNRLVRLCCAGCEKPVRAEPDKFISKLDAAVIEQQMAAYPFDKCLVSGEELNGAHGKAIDKVVANRLVRFCCASCVVTFNENPAKYLKMLDTGTLETGEGSDSKHEGEQH